MTTNVYDDLNRHLSSTTNGQVTSYTYDRNGNRVTQDSGGHTEYFYDTSDRLISVQVDGDEVFSAAYDARTRRLAKTEIEDFADDVVTTFRYDGGTNIQERKDPDGDLDLTLELIRAGGLGGGIGSVLYTDRSMDPSQVSPIQHPTEHFIYNAVGHTVALSNDDEGITQTNVYEAFGEKATGGSGSTNNRLAGTKERDASIGLDNHGFRYYDPASGRYLTRDPIGYGDGLNVYLSVHNNPINHVDPLGLSESNTLGVFAAIAKGVKSSIEYVAGTAIDSVNAVVIVASNSEQRLYDGTPFSKSYFTDMGSSTEYPGLSAQAGAYGAAADMIPGGRATKGAIAVVSSLDNVVDGAKAVEAYIDRQPSEQMRSPAPVFLSSPLWFSAFLRLKQCHASNARHDQSSDPPCRSSAEVLA